MGEKAGRAPQQLLFGALLLNFESFDDFFQITVRFGKGGPLGGDIAVVEAVEINARFFQEFKKHRDPPAGVVERVRAIVPGHEGRGRTEGVGETVAHAMPVGGGKTQMLAHGFTRQFFGGIVMLEGESVLGLRPFVANNRNFGERGHGGRRRRAPG